jgi:hypothetical protein
MWYHFICSVYFERVHVLEEASLVGSLLGCEVDVPVTYQSLSSFIPKDEAILLSLRERKLRRRQRKTHCTPNLS